jgi:hypothetical protein
MTTGSRTYVSACRCGEVRLEASGAPILSVTCHCESCGKAAAGFATLPGTPRVLDAEGGTEFTMFRKDRVTCVRGAALLRLHRLTPEATTRRVLARCCDSPMFLEFTKGHWLSLYRDRIGAEAPPIEMRVMTGDRREGAPLSGDLPSYGTHSFTFMWRLFAAWAAMGFRVPALEPIEAA